MRDSVSGNKYAKSGPFKKFKCILKIAVTVGLGFAANKYNYSIKKIIINYISINKIYIFLIQILLFILPVLLMLYDKDSIYI